MRSVGRFALVSALLAACVAATPAFAAGSDGQALTETAAALGAGQFAWGEPAAQGGPVSIVVSIPLQQLFVYRGAKLLAVSSVSTGRPGHETPVGTFTILEKAVTHRSNKYNDAAMPYMERLTWDGVAIHAGGDPGRPSSHGCVHVPLAFAKRLYAITAVGARVAIVDDATAPGLPGDYARAPAETPDAVESTDPEQAATRAANLGATPAASPAPTSDGVMPASSDTVAAAPGNS